MSSSTTEATTLVDVAMPQLGVSVSEGTLVSWRVQVGDVVAYEQTICEVATDKIDVECPSPAAGTIAELLVEPDQTVDVGTVIARIATAGEVPQPLPGPPMPDPSPPVPAPDPQPPIEPDPVPTPQPEPSPPVMKHGGGPKAGFLSPVVQRVAAEHGIDASTLEGSGLGGRVTKRDVLRAARNGHAPADGNGAEPPLHIESPYREDEPAPAAAAPPPSAPAGTPAQGERLSRIRRLIGERMRSSLDTAAHCTTIAEADMSAVERRRRELGTTYLPVVARCAIDALRAHPQLNAWLQDGERHTIHEQIDLGIAVDLGEGGGLLVPVIRDAQRLSEEGLAEAIRDLARRARSGALAPEELEGGTFTITNPGAYGAIAATPVINIPQVAILDLEAVVKRPVVITDEQGADAIAIRPMTNLCLSWDHRALDGVLAARFLRTLRERLERC